MGMSQFKKNHTTDSTYSLLIFKHGPTSQQSLYLGIEEIRFKQVSVRRCHPVSCQHL